MFAGYSIETGLTNGNLAKLAQKDMFQTRNRVCSMSVSSNPRRYKCLPVEGGGQKTGLILLSPRSGQESPRVCQIAGLARIHEQMLWTRNAMYPAEKEDGADNIVSRGGFCKTLRCTEKQKKD